MSIEKALTPEAIQIVRTAFARLTPIQEDLGSLFYSKLFEMDPELRALFHDEPATQGRMFMTALQLIVTGLDRPEHVAAQTHAIGERHIAYGALPADFDRFGAALLWTLQQGLGPEYTPEFEAAWIQAFELIRRGMKLRDSKRAGGRSSEPNQ